MADERHDVVSCRSAFVDYEAEVFFRDLSTAYRKTSKTAVHDEFSCEVPFRSLESTPRARKLKRLLRDALFSEIIHCAANLADIPLGQCHFRFKDNCPVLHERGTSVAKLQLLTGNFADTAILKKRGHRFQDIFHFTAVCAGVHNTGSADAARNSSGKFHTGK